MHPSVLSRANDSHPFPANDHSAGRALPVTLMRDETRDRPCFPPPA